MTVEDDVTPRDTSKSEIEVPLRCCTYVPLNEIVGRARWLWAAFCMPFCGLSVDSLSLKCAANDAHGHKVTRMCSHCAGPMDF